MRYPSSAVSMRFVAYASRLRKIIEPLADRFFGKAWPSYLFIVAFQLKRIWGIWWFRDLTLGDTSSYFLKAHRWYENLTADIVWSPLYTAFYGTALLFTNDVYAATILHRVIIVMVAAVGVLAVMRRLLPPAFALTVAVWWAFLPINFDPLYEVHLFALLPVLAAWLVAGSSDTSWARGSALAILVVAAVLARLEFLVGVIVYALVCLVRETLELRQDRNAIGPTRQTRIAAYGVPLLLAVGLCAVFFWRSYIPDTLQHANARHVSNVCQGYAFTWLQIHPEATLDPWFECDHLTEEVFGRHRPTILQMIAANPAAAWEFLWWNFSLSLNGLQLALFDGWTGWVNPDFGPVRHRHSVPATVATIVVLFFVVKGGLIAVRQWGYWWKEWFQPRKGLWLIMLAMVCVSVPVVFVVRPRPSYLFPTTLVLMALIGTAAYIVSSRDQPRVPKALAIIALPLLLIATPPYFKAPADRPLYGSYQTLRPFAALLADERNRIIIGDYAWDLKNYLMLGERSTTFGYGILSSWQAPQSLDQFLDAQGINVFFVQPGLLEELRTKPEARALLEHPESLGWHRLAPADPGDTTWLLLYREPRPLPPRAAS